jgi:hypothetical protein
MMLSALGHSFSSMQAMMKLASLRKKMDYVVYSVK